MKFFASFVLSLNVSGPSLAIALSRSGHINGAGSGIETAPRVSPDASRMPFMRSLILLDPPPADSPDSERSYFAITWLVLKSTFSPLTPNRERREFPLCDTSCSLLYLTITAGEGQQILNFERRDRYVLAKSPAGLNSASFILSRNVFVRYRDWISSPACAP